MKHRITLNFFHYSDITSEFVFNVLLIYYAFKY